MNCRLDLSCLNYILTSLQSPFIGPVNVLLSSEMFPLYCCIDSHVYWSWEGSIKCCYNNVACTHVSSVMLAYCVGKGQPEVLLYVVNNWFLFLGSVKERLLGQPVRHLYFFYCFSHSVRIFLLHTHAHNPLWTFHRNMHSIYCVFKLNLFPLGQNHWKLSLWSRAVNMMALIQTHWVKFCAFGSSNKWKWNSFGT